ncbi:hypothetical protein ACTHOQ_02120 [Solibacillus silvestris]|uniref:hypothetical protein n=1 Tax=Solibacillus silvestris TaxID=76853 RepID=UPI003F7D0B77
MKKRWLVLAFMLIFLLAACGNTDEENLPHASETVAVYESDETFTHNMEGVTLMFDYSIEKVSGKVMESKSTNLQPGDFILEISGTIQNDFDQMIYYTPNFNIVTLQNVKVEQLSSSFENEQILVNPQMETNFSVAYLLPGQLYSENASLNVHVPAAFKEPNSESSGDALGDSANWQIPIK